MLSPILVLALITAWLVVVRGSLWDYAAYGDELRSAHVFWNLSSAKGFNEAAYFSEHRRCYSLPGVWAPNSNLLEWCFKDINGRYRQTAALWTPTIASQPPLWLVRQGNNSAGKIHHTLLDCSYTVEAIALEHVASEGRLEYRFRISQSACRNDVGGDVGGTTFEIFGFNTLFLANCVSEFAGEANYHVKCTFAYSHAAPLRNDFAKRLETRAKCINLTVVIDHEHFDAFSEVLSDRFTPINHFYISPRAVLEDNKEFCFSSVHTRVDLGNNSSLKAAMPRHVSYYSAAWPSLSLLSELHPTVTIQTYDSRNTSAKRGRYQGPVAFFGNGSFHTTIECKEWTNTSNLRHEYERLSPSEAKEMSTTVPSISMIPADQLAETYTYELVKFSSKIEEVIARDFMQNVSFNPAESEHSKIHFVGASHMRYFYDALHEMTFGPSANDAWDRKHSSTSSHNFVFNYVKLADDAADLLLKLCQEGVKNSSPGIKVVIHPGPWDLASASLRLFMREDNSLQRILRLVHSIMDGTHSCPSLEMLVWVLQAPFPLCYDDSNFICNQWRDYRFNPSIAAPNKHILNSLIHLKSSPASARLVIMDMYSIIRPRLGFDEDAEVACAAHFVCRIGWDRDSATIWTLGGKATFDAIVHAVSTT